MLPLLIFVIKLFCAKNLDNADMTRWTGILHHPMRRDETLGKIGNLSFKHYNYIIIVIIIGKIGHFNAKFLHIVVLKCAYWHLPYFIKEG